MMTPNKAAETMRRNSSGPGSDFYKAVITGLIRSDPGAALGATPDSIHASLDALIYEACLIRPPADSRALLAWLDAQAKTAPRYELNGVEYLALPWHELARIRCYASGRKNPVYTVVFMSTNAPKTPDVCRCLVMGPDPYSGQAWQGKKSRARVGGTLVSFSKLPEPCRRYTLESTLHALAPPVDTETPQLALSDTQAPASPSKTPGLLSPNNARLILTYNHSGRYSAAYIATALGLVFEGPQADNPSPAAASLAALRLDAEKIKKESSRRGLLAWLDDQEKTAPGVEIDGRRYLALPWCFLLNLECYKAPRQGADEIYRALFTDRLLKGGRREALEMRGGHGGWRGYKERLAPGAGNGHRVNLDELPGPCLRYVVRYGVAPGMDPENRVSNWIACRQKIRLV